MENGGPYDRSARSAQLERAAADASRMLAARRNATRGGEGAAQPDYPDRTSRVGRTEADGRPSRGSHARPAQGGSLGQFVSKNIVYILGVVAVVFVVTLIILLLRVVMPSLNEPFEFDVAGESVYESPYDWSCLDRTNGRYQYIVDGKVKSKFGIDVSEAQKEIDWSAVAGDGVDFAIVRLGYRGMTEGDVHLDEYYQQNLSGARAAGLSVGVYFFSQAINEAEAIEEANFVIDHLNSVALEYPVVFDSEPSSAYLGEGRTAGLSQDEMEQIAQAFCSRIQAAGYTPIVYGNATDIDHLGESIAEKYPIWWAEYGVDEPSTHLDIAIWQYANDGLIDGVPMAVDLNIDLSRVLS